MMKKNNVLIGLLLAWSGSAIANNEQLDSLMTMSLEELSMLDVTMETASKTEQELADIPASVYVLSGERILRSGAANITEALALIPGMYVSKSGENFAMVSTRGFHDGLYNKMLVMVDGRSIYSPVYGGVYWTTLDYILADIDRIEVVRGPSGAIWGGNAANGVINIITKSAQDTQGSYVAATVGRYDTYEVSVRQGLQLSDDVYGRAFYKTKNVPEYLSNDAEPWRTDSAGVVIDGRSNRSEWSFRFGGTKTAYHQTWETYQIERDTWATTVNASKKEFESSLAYAQFEYQTELEDGDKLNSSIYIDRGFDSALDAPGEYYTLDLETNYVMQQFNNHRLLFGAGVRYQWIDFTTSISEFDPYNAYSEGRFYDQDKANDMIANIYVQSEYQWTDTISTTIGTKAEYFEVTDRIELSPQARVMYRPNERNSLWAGVGRVAIAPSYMESNSYYMYNYSDPRLENDQLCPLCFVTYVPNDELDTESVVTYEVGYRTEITSNSALGVTGYFSTYDNVRGSDHPELIISEDGIYNWAYYTSDDFEAKASGIEVTGSFDLAKNFSLFTSYSYLTLDVRRNGFGSEEYGDIDVFQDIENQHLLSLQTLWDVTDTLQLDFVVQYQDIEYGNEYYNWRSESENEGNNTIHDVEAFVSLDARVSWQKHDKAPRFEFIAQNIGNSGYFDAWNLYSNEERLYVRVSHEF
ncbi:TonB-dependent receptor plug domain-containing protein [Vibrio maerlii]|uniref:TonB-dependent receptor plug domain-containing protein n=1 Tax=Vibrio maerlii TaxID=2231648 RepID=UPI0013E03CB6|nr:TonB-dependent receptor [Vibrio maerlii]